MSDTSKPEALSRRDFGRRAVTAVAAALVSGPLAAHADAPSAADPVKDTPDSEEAAVDAKLANVVRKYGDRLSQAQRRRLRDIIAGNQQMMKRVRDFALENADAPATGLRLYPRDSEPGEPGEKDRHD
ncbi:MAG TPA: hypothetical protein VFW40_13995 [Capsulimonadaceae bacterium]|nr:hypothetical protein [Capsulimonadaceae bacterium]